jgi:hypothetical protein
MELHWAFLRLFSQYLFSLSTFTSEIFLYNLVYKSFFSERYKVERRDCMSTENASGTSSPRKSNEE